MTGRRGMVVVAMTLTATVAAGCGWGGSHPTIAGRAAPTGGGSMPGGFSETPSPEGGSGAGPTGGVAAGAAAAGSAGLGAGTSGGGPGGGEAGRASPTAAPPQPGSNIQVGLRAGSVDDNARFADYLTYRQAFDAEHLATHSLDVTERHTFTVATPSGDPVLGADVAILDGGGKKVSELRTYSDGRALWFPRATGVGDAQRFTAVVSKDNATKTVTLDRSVLDHRVVLDAQPRPGSVPLDIEFLVDATGSMADEIAQLKASMADIAGRIAALPAHPDVRFALTIYRDRVDSFLTRTWNFTSDVGAFQQSIAGVTAEGGGDYPEDVQQGLHDALTKPSWRGPGTVKVVFLVGDAPPHLDYPDDPDYVTDVTSAARDGIKIESLGASGLDDQGEYIWRQLAEVTLGQFLFLTYGPNDTTTHHVSGYTPDNLDDLVIRLVSAELLPSQASRSGDRQTRSSTSATTTTAFAPPPSSNTTTSASH